MRFSTPALLSAALIGASTLAASAQMSSSPAPAMAPAMSSSMPSVTDKISAQNGSNETGSAVLTQDGPNVVVTVKVSNAGTEPQPIHIHKGTCATLDPKPAYPLTTMVNGSSMTTLKDMKLSSLTTGGFAINIHKSTTDIGTYVACGDIPKAGAM